jgi:MFS family permease
MGFTSATYVSFLLSEGLSLLEVNLVNTVFFVTLFLCEIPTGAFADVFGRKKSYVVSCFLFSAGLLLYGSGFSMWSFIVAEILAAIAATFASGAFDAWLVDSLRHHGYQDKLTAIFSNAWVVRRVGMLASALTGSALADYAGLGAPWLLGSLFFAIAGVVAVVTLKEEYFERKRVSIEEGMRALRSTVTTSIEYGVKNRRVRFIMCLVFAINFSLMAPNMYWQPYFKTWLGSQTSLGFLFVGIMVSMMGGSWFTGKVHALVSERHALCITSVLIGLGILIAANLPYFGIVITAFYLHEFARGAFTPLKDTYLHEMIPSKERATIVSFESIAHHIGGAIGLVGSGVLATLLSISVAWTVSAVVLLLLTAFIWKYGNGTNH